MAGTESLADIIGLDRDLLAVAAGGAPQAASSLTVRDMERWLSGLAMVEHVALLSRVTRGDGRVSAELTRRFRQHAPRPATTLPLRTASELRAGAEAIATKRREVARERENRQRAKREREERAARQRYLTDLAKREHQAWLRVDALVDTKRPRDYDAAVQLLLDLCDMSRRKGRETVFTQRIAALRGAHAKKSTLLTRLTKAGL